MTWNGQIAEPNPNEHVLAGALEKETPIEPKFFLELLTSYSNFFNTEPRFFDHFLNFPATASAYATGATASLAPLGMHTYLMHRFTDYFWKNYICIQAAFKLFFQECYGL